MFYDREGSDRKLALLSVLCKEKKEEAITNSDNLISPFMKEEWKGWDKEFFPSSGLASSSVPAGSFLHSCLCWMCSREALDQAGTCAHCQVEAEELPLCLPHARKLLLLQMRNHLCERRGWLHRQHSCWKGIWWPRICHFMLTSSGFRLTASLILILHVFLIPICVTLSGRASPDS